MNPEDYFKYVSFKNLLKALVVILAYTFATLAVIQATIWMTDDSPVTTTITETETETVTTP